MLVVNPNHSLNNPYSAIEPPLWAGLTASFWDADILDAEAAGLSIEQTATFINHSNHKDIMIIVMGNNPSVSSTPKMAIAEELADRLDGRNVCLIGLHPNAAGSKYPVNRKPFVGMPMMLWHKLSMMGDAYRAHVWHCLDGSPRSPYASIYTSMGCSYSCYYCPIHALYPDRQVKLRGIMDIAFEMEILVGVYGVSNIKIWDELFALKEERVIEICKIFQQYRGLNIWAYSRLDTITEKMLKAMSDSGFKWLACGFEGINDRKFLSTKAEDVIKMTRDAGINIIANFMFGLPNTTEDDDKRSLDFAMKHLFEFVNFYDAKPYPGSQWYEDVKPNNIEFDQYKEISPFRQKAFHEYFSNPDYLNMLGNKWGEQAIKTIKDMEAWKINPA